MLFVRACRFGSLHLPRVIGSWLLGVLIGIALVAATEEAHATTTRVPESYVSRKLTLPSGVLRFDAGHHWPFNDALFKHVVLRGARDLQFANPGLTFGVADHLEFGLVAPVRLSPDLHIEDPRLHVLFQFIERDVEVGAFSSLRLGFFDHTELVAGVPVAVHIQRNLRLDTGGFFDVVFGEYSSVALVAPAQLAFQITKAWYAGPETGIILYNLFDDGSGVAIPLGGFVGYTITSGGGTLGDLYSRVRIHDLANGFDAVSLMFGLELFFNL